MNVNPKKASPKLRSGAFLIQRELSSGKQDFDTDRKMWPVNQPMPKIESIYQTSGEGEYINDLIIRENEVFCALTLADAPGAFDKIETEEALVNIALMNCFKTIFRLMTISIRPSRTSME